MPAPVVRIVSDSSVATSSASKLDDLPAVHHGSEHAHRRFFIGPMPEKLLPSPEELNRLQKRKRKALFNQSNDSREDEEDETNETIARIVRDSARSFFLHEGGREEDWGENEEQNTREEMYRRWKESDWGVVLGRLWKDSESDKPKHGATNRWIGGSFEIGNIAGINIIQEAEIMTRVSSRTSATSLAARFVPFDSDVSKMPSVSAPASASEATVQETSVTAQSRLSPSNALSIPQNGSFLIVNRVSEDAHWGEASASSSSSTTSLLRPKSSRQGSTPSQARTEPKRRPIVKLPFDQTDDAVGSSQNKGKKTVHYDLSPISMSPVQEAASPAEVLERRGEEVADTSAGSMSVSAASHGQFSWGDVVMRDRMLVRVYSSDSDAILRFNESVHRTARDLDFEDWGEFLVAWRKDRLELYENYDIPAKEWLTGHKHLAHIVPLDSARTRLSLYSFVDLTFCITCPPTSRRFDAKTVKWSIHSSKERTNIFVFKLRSRSRAMDWMWHLWQHRGGRLPPVVEIRNPRLDSKVKIDTPNVDTPKTYQIFARENVIALSVQSLHAVRDWKYSIERQIAEGKVLQLCWRMESMLDWIWLDNDVDGRPRNWVVLCGLALKQLNVPVHLEIRLGEHYSNFVHQKDGTRLQEPPGVEGYLERFKPNTQSKQNVYLVTHDGNLFTLDPSRSHPPSPLGATLEAVGEEGESYAEALRRSEVERGKKQIMDATGVCDLRSILAVKRAMHPVPRHTHDLKELDDENWATTWQAQMPERTVSDEEDEGEEENLNKSQDKRQLRMKRSFELLLKSGHVVRFEAYSCKIALEWVERLQVLVHYWKMKHRSDAREEMDVSQAHRPLLTPHTYVDADRTIYAETPPDEGSPLPALGYLYNWCVLEGCKAIIRSGKVFMRQGLHGQYKLVELFLVKEHLVQFHITPKSALHPAMRRKISLSDAYVGSGYFAAQVLPSGQYNPEANNAPRRYQDGLEVDDPEEDRLFVVWYRNSVTSDKAKSNPENERAQDDGTVPPLAAKRKVAIFRTRSKLERDSWCWALNSELERLVRARKEREMTMRESGKLMDL